VLVGRRADFASLPAEIVHGVASCMHDLHQCNKVPKARWNSAIRVTPSLSSLHYNPSEASSCFGPFVILIQGCLRVYTYPAISATTIMGMRLQKTESSFFQSRSFSGHSARSAQSSPTASPTVEKTGFLPTPEPEAEYRRPLSPNTRSRPSSRLRNGSPPSSTSARFSSTSTTSTLDPSTTERDDKKSRRKSWFGRSQSTERVDQKPTAWILGHPELHSYDIAGLTRSEHLPEYV